MMVMLIRRLKQYETICEVEGMNDLYLNIEKLVKYALKSGLIEEDEAVYSRNLILDIFKESDFEECEAEFDDSKDEYPGQSLEKVLNDLMDIAIERGLMEEGIVSRDLFDTRIMNAFAKRPSQVNKEFMEHYNNSPEEATDFFYKFSQDTDYIRRYRLCKDQKWTYESNYGTLDITINLSKPEKDPKAIAAAKSAKQTSYPKCQLCLENIGYAGRMNHPARETHRVIPLTINDSNWGFQYSPYGYYNEHCIVLNGEHVPMKIERATFIKLFDFVKQFPHYILGSNADLPIVGGSILSHDHYQGGRYEFAMAKAPIEKEFTIKGYEDVKAGIVKWPMSVIRIAAKDSDRLIDLATHILDVWRDYSDEAAFVFANTDGEPHNTITPIARARDGIYELDLVLRNNITTDECPLGVYHPHNELHHIKKENIGLIEVMGLAILPARLKKELKELEDAIVNKTDLRATDSLACHADWAESFIKEYDDINANNAAEIIKVEVGKVFEKVLEDAGVFKCTEEGREAFVRFVNAL